MSYLKHKKSINVDHDGMRRVLNEYGIIVCMNVCIYINILNFLNTIYEICIEILLFFLSKNIAIFQSLKFIYSARVKKK